MGIINLIFTVVNFSFGVGIRGWNRNRIIETKDEELISNRLGCRGIVGIPGFYIFLQLLPFRILNVSSF
jgi:hypothetical protein